MKILSCRVFDTKFLISKQNLVGSATARVEVLIS